MNLSRSCAVAACAVLVSACAHTAAPPSSPMPLPGISGMAPMSDGRYLVVIDTKAYSDDLRFGALDAVAKGGSRFQPLPAQGWAKVGGKSNDLEAVCALQGRDDEFLAAESSYRDAEYGRVFHLRVRAGRVELLKALALPSERSNGKDKMGYEGLACARIEGERHLLVLGERGGSPLRPHGSLRLGEFDAGRGALTWRGGETRLHTPGHWRQASSHRDIADLYVDGEGALWAVAASDPDEYGPFRSLVWRVGVLDVRNAADPLRLVPGHEPSWIIDGFKVEALSAPDPHIPGSVLSIGSEDEKLGGAWRSLGPAN
ncbi:hypothetical protein EBB59_10275 [Lysobacter pythonis]|uniref:Phytase-like domain-containing protein n=1 Tax=Solilutibacter pythonis TaxID=2483112 RepID=A0A3M2HNI9_9GAMM|nr:esterase-like activity of phytase family protein [Lysobacter pythonis]RMH89473.1 hypothetical protein EBB59_10275 [Lysobacter pythonis]